MKRITLILAVMAIVTFGCKSGEKSDGYILDNPTETNPGVPDGHNSRTSLDWEGVYEGTTPCADCEGIETKLTLNSDNTFELTQTYLGKKEENTRYTSSGDFTWNEAGSNIILKAQDITIRFQVGENEVTMLDMAGNVVSGELANFYVLKKK
jgi:uncharacterized lipoprotein NlpE involved in copper resistance